MNAQNTIIIKLSHLGWGSGHECMESFQKPFLSSFHILYGRACQTPNKYSHFFGGGGGGVNHMLSINSALLP